MPPKLRVLIIDDSEPDALLITRYLQRGGFELDAVRVQTAGQLQGALDGREWDAVICDYKMPEFDGFSALRMFKERRIDIPFIVVSGMIGEEAAVTMMKAGAHDYLLKDNLLRLVPALQRELREAEERKEHRRAEAEREKLLCELQRALAEVKTLSGLLPICAGCKRIRDDTGYWHQVEVYIKRHSNARLTHGLCPHCMEHLYPEYTKPAED